MPVELPGGVQMLVRGEYGGHYAGRNLMTVVAELWVHHSVTNEEIGVNPTDDAKSDFAELDAIGMSRGHRGMSYSYAIHPNGLVGEGQGNFIGAHTLNHNSTAFGVVFIGNYETDELTDEAIHAFRSLRDYLISKHWLYDGIYPTGGHRDTFPTACPGANVYYNIDDLRRSLEAKPSEPPPTLKRSRDMFLFANADKLDGNGNPTELWIFTPQGLVAIPPNEISI